MEEKVALIGDSTVQKYLSVKAVMERVEQTYEWYARGKIIMPSKITMDMTSAGVPGFINSMPSYIQPCDTAGIKWVGGFSNNYKIGLPYIKAKILLTDPRTGLLKALIDGDWISDMRTGAQTAVFAKYLAGSKNPVLTIIGLGIQGYTTLICLCELFEFNEIRIYDINTETSRSFISKIDGIIKTQIKSFTSIRDAVENADIIVTATTADKPLVMNEWVKPGALVSTIGSYQELDEQLVLKADKVIVDQIGQHLHRGELVRLFESSKLRESDIYGEFPDILIGKLPGRINDQERIVISIVGMGCLDVSIAEMLYEFCLSDKKEHFTFFNCAI